MRHGSLFSGIGGFDLAAEWMGWENVFQVEIDDYCTKVLEKNFPNVKRFRDIKEFEGEAGSVDILTGGFPCQPFSHAGKRKGTDDDRYLWPEYLRVIREIQPSYVVGENVAGLTSMDDGKTLDGILFDLEGEGYVTEQFIIPACGVGAWHRRDRIWIIGYKRDSPRTNPNESGSHRKKINEQRETEFRHQQERESGQVGEDVPNPRTERPQPKEKDGELGGGQRFSEHSNGIRGERREPTTESWWQSEPNVGRVANGVPKKLDRFVPTPNAWDGRRGPGIEYNPDSKSQKDRTLETFVKKGGYEKQIFGDGFWKREPDIPRVATGIKNRVDRLKGLGNAIVPQVAYEIFRAIDAIAKKS